MKIKTIAKFVLATAAIVMLVGAAWSFWQLGDARDDINKIYPEGLRDHYRQSADTEFDIVRENPAIDGIRRQVMSFTNDNLLQYALVLTPAGEPPAAGWPAVIYNHGYHPRPEEHGQDKHGNDNRPGDYYRGIPQRFAAAGYIVVAPDYRGHNVSEGREFTTDLLAPFWYVRDVIAALNALDSLPHADTDQVFMFGHSMGGAMTLSVLTAVDEKIKAAALWSTAYPERWYYRIMRLRLPRLWNDEMLAATKVPVQIHHGVHDETTPVKNAHAIARVLGERSEVHLYDSKEHLLRDEDFEQSVRRTLDWFARFKGSK